MKPLSLAVIFLSIIFTASCSFLSESVKSPMPSPSPTPVAEEDAAEEELEINPTLDMDSRDYGLQIIDDELRQKTDEAFGKIKVTSLRSVDYFRLPYEVPLMTEVPFERSEIRIYKSFGDIDGDGKEEVFVLIDEIPQGSASFAHGFLIGIDEGNLKVLAIMPDGTKFANDGLGEFLGGYITKGELRIFRWAWDNLYTPLNDDEKMKDIMVTTVYKMKNGRLVSDSVSGIFIKDYPNAFWPKEPNIMSPKREAEFIKKAKIGDVDLTKPIEKTSDN
jgi:hypothetical protein